MPRIQAGVAHNGWRREALLPLVGLLVLLRIFRLPIQAPTVSWQMLLVAAAVLYGFVMLLGVLVSLGQPAFYAFGLLPAELRFSVLTLAFWLLLRHKGQRYLAQWEAACC